ncbi:hypothetical protein [Polyangium aurulentum]|uniref:hypothetical protein n=1 Tax=Polyangium aurulentum TaxID=2567896 RepID=UPI0010AE1D2D|nr:hypothetical protein [Polyangium aurulentum]UQA57419.1 hypothetical protein E8A73_040060 [Polyangium aurulentum]
MKLEARRLVDQVLASETPCLGAVFCSYTFDPAYFEDHVLRSLLRLQGDPEEDGARYHEEARAALRETPVACFVDAGVRRGGRRLPYDLQLVRRRTFHPKVVLVLYEAEARLAVGSGNTTKAGFEQNTELFFTRALRYDSPADAALLRSVDGFLEGCADLATHRGTQLALVRSALAARIASTPPPEGRASIDIGFVHTFQSAMLEAMAGAIPRDARTSRVAVLSPFFEQDDMDAAHDSEGLSSVLAELLALRSTEGTPSLDIGVPWDDAPLAPAPCEQLPSLNAGAKGLWARRTREQTEGGVVDRVEYLVVDRVTAKRVEARDAAGRPCRYDRASLEEEIAEGRLWPVATPTVHAPKRILERIAAEYPVQLWLHPTAQLSTSGRASRRPLHAKLFLVTATRRGKTATYGLAGSANASRAALARSVEQGGNVEAGIVFCIDGEARLHDVLPTLVSHALDDVHLEEREPPGADIDLSAWIADVVHDAAARTLAVHWSDKGPAQLGAWELRYLDRKLVGGVGPGIEPTIVSDFELAAASAEVELRSGGRSWFLPIRVEDLAMLPTNASLVGLGVRELLALLGRRVGQERLGTLRQQRGPLGVATVLDAVFGEGFGPTDVFKAWWGLREDLSAAPTVAAFRYRLLGPTGARTVWQKLCEIPPDELSEDEVWVYGCELLRELGQVDLADGPDRAAKAEMLAELVTSIRIDLGRLAPPTGSRSWVGSVIRFYGLGENHGNT